MYQKRLQRSYWYQQLVSYFPTGGTYRAAYLAYSTLISLVPMLALAITILSHLRYFDHIMVSWESWLLEGFLVDNTSSLKPLLSQLVQHASMLSWWYIAIFTAMAFLMMVNIGLAFRHIWDSRPSFSLTLRFLIYFLVLLLSPVLLAIMFMGGGILNQWLALLIAKSGYAFLSPALSKLSYALLFVWFFLMNFVLPGCKVPVRAAALSGGLTVVFLWLARITFDFVMAHFSTYQVLYGSLSVIPLFLIWLYVSWLLILLAASIGHRIVTPDYQFVS